MLDLDHPDTPPTFAIAREDGAVLSIAKRMTLVSTETKQSLHARAVEHCDNMRSITRSHWRDSEQKLSAIDQLQADMERLASLASSNDFATDWKGKDCTVCGSRIEDLKGYAEMVYCRECIKVVDVGRDAVNQAFGLWSI